MSGVGLIVTSLMLQASAADIPSEMPATDIVGGAIKAAASGNQTDFERFLDDGTESLQIGIRHIEIAPSDLAPPAGCKRPAADIQEIRPRMVLMSWMCGSTFSGVRKTVLVSPHKVVAILPDVTEGGN